MKVALAQLNYTVGAVQSNKIKIINSIYKAREQGADLVVFSEYAISGAYCYDLLSKASFLESCEVALIEIAYHCEGISALVGLPIANAKGKPVSAAAFIEDRQIKRYIGKKNIKSRDERGFITPASGCQNIRIAGRNVSVVISDDLLLEDHLGIKSDIIIALFSNTYSKGIIQVRHDYISDIVFKAGKSFAGVSLVGSQVDVVFDGTSAAYDHNGQIVALLKSFEEDFCVVDLEKPAAIDFPEQNHARNVYKAIKLGLSDYFEKNGFTRACVGLSGGIDSAVVLAMAVEALGAENVRAMMLPSKFSSEHSVNDAIEMATNIGVGFDVIPINQAYDAMLESLIPVIGGTPFNVTEENIQARIRCAMLMALSNKKGYILLDTMNKSEAAMGYGTLYGDIAGSLSIIGDLYKMDVYMLARHINRKGNIIPENIIRKAPSAELRPGQLDSDSLPPYDVLDAILFRFIELGQSMEEITNAGFDHELVHRIFESVKHSSFKRQQSCPVLRLSVRPFESGLRFPMINKYVF